MRITASHIVDWANTHAKEAQAALPRLIRRLCYEPSVTALLSFPAGDSTYVPGWDGTVSHQVGNAWVPLGLSRWEIGCDRDVQAKANSDYQKRVEKVDEQERSKTAFVFVTPRRWTKKADWLAQKKGQREWADVKAYDADDLEQWLEQTPAVSLQFAEEMGLAGWGVVSLARFWDGWARQCIPEITPDALVMGRALELNALNEKLRSTTADTDVTNPLSIRADSMDEAAAFVAAATMASGELRHQALVVIDPAGWRYVEANTQIRIAIAARAEIASHPIMRKGLRVIVPYASGDMAGRPNGDELVLERPSIYDFEKALVHTGMEDSDAKRYALSTGRSWTVLRRQRATNPAIRRPGWLDSPNSASLPLLCLLGAWKSDCLADRQIIERIADQTYEEVEADLRQLARVDDAPVLNIGMVWKAKSPLELLTQCGDRITTGQLDRFFAVAEEILSIPDPQLELPEGERWLAQLRGQVHQYSSLLFESICDSLLKLAVRGEEQPGLQSLCIEQRVSSLILSLLDGADGRRWLSLASYLPTLAEAAPDEFLRAVQKSLSLPGAPVTRLITESASSGGFGGRCWHAELLWALEMLGWAPRRLGPVSLILAHLRDVPMEGNWGNKPGESLLSLFRCSYPQTAASLEERIKVLDFLINKSPEAGFSLLLALVGREPNVVFLTHRPKWRDDDAGAGRGVSGEEVAAMVLAAKERLFTMSAGDASRTVRVIKKIHLVDELDNLLLLLAPFLLDGAADGDREAIRAELRNIIYWHKNYSDEPVAELESKLQVISGVYEQLVAKDMVLRHQWLFDNHWLDLPEKDEGDGIEAKGLAVLKLRISALNQIHEFYSMRGVNRLICECAEPGIVGSTLTRVEWINSVEIADWLLSAGADFAKSSSVARCLVGIFESYPMPIADELLQKLIRSGLQHKWEVGRLAKLLTLAVARPATWRMVEECGPEVSAAYWQQVSVHPRADEIPGYVMEQLLAVKRPLSALHYCQYAIEKTDPHQLLAALELFLTQGGEGESRLESWHLEKMIERLEACQEIDRMTLVRLEFGLFPLLRYGRESKAALLYEALMTQPEIFKELVCMVFAPENGERKSVDDLAKAAAERAYSVLHSCRRLPGVQDDGRIDRDVLLEFVRSTRGLCRDADRLTMCDQTLGEILAHAPADAEGAWPCEPVREVLDDFDAEQLRKGFCIGCFNKRGVSTRSMWDGGEQERALAETYRGHAERVRFSHPNVAAVMDDLAKGYEHDGRREDTAASLRKEGL